LRKSTGAHGQHGGSLLAPRQELHGPHWGAALSPFSIAAFCRFFDRQSSLCRFLQRSCIGNGNMPPAMMFIGFFMRILESIAKEASTSRVRHGERDRAAAACPLLGVRFCPVFQPDICHFSFYDKELHRNTQ
jgi:hypothetical protein